MKTINNIIKSTLTGILLCMVALQANAQWNPRHINAGIDWQMNAPVSTDFADDFSGWGMNFQVTYNFTPRWDLGLFAGFHTNHNYMSRQTIQLSPTESLTTDQQQSAFEIPFGISTGYTIYQGRYVRPYVGAKVGTVFTRYTSYMGSGGVYDKSWGVYLSPEVGLKIYPCPDRCFGFKIAGYYNYESNHTNTIIEKIEGRNNIGLRLGMFF